MAYLNRQKSQRPSGALHYCPQLLTAVISLNSFSSDWIPMVLPFLTLLLPQWPPYCTSNAPRSFFFSLLLVTQLLCLRGALSFKLTHGPLPHFYQIFAQMLYFSKNFSEHTEFCIFHCISLQMLSPSKTVFYLFILLTVYLLTLKYKFHED